MATRSEQSLPRRVGLLPLWYGLLAGPLAWTAHLLLSYHLVPLVCATGLEIVLHGITLVTAGITLLAGLVAWRSWRKSQPPAETASASLPTDRTARFMALAGILLSGLFLLVILAQGLPVFLQDACVPAGGLGI